MEWLQNGESYVWLKAFHLIFVISWMAGLLYLPRLFVYHCQVTPGSEESNRFIIMERKLMRIIMNPAMVLSFLFGFLLASAIDAWSQPWFHAKLTMLVLMMVIHMKLSIHRKAFARDENNKSERYYRILNEAPAILMIIIVILAVVKPF